MKPNILRYTVLIFIICYNANLFAQPFTLDKNIKPIKLELTEHPKYKGAKYLEGSLLLKQKSVNYHYVKGHDIFQFVDIFIFANDTRANLKADIVYNTWGNIEETQKTATSKNGVINFKVRSYQDIGFTVTSEESNNIPYTVIVNASPEGKNYLGSPFTKATEKNMKSDSGSGKSKVVSTSNSNIWIYIIIGVLLLLVGLLVGKLMGRKKTMLFIFLPIFFVFNLESYGQTETEIVNQEAVDGLHEARIGQINGSIDRINEAFETEKALEDFYTQYRNLGSCLGSGSPPGQPRIPSFCDGEESACADCFASARAEFNRCRYNLEKLQTIYNCSKAYTDAAVALGDNVSGYHGVVGIVWQSQKRGIMRSIAEVEKAYDKKRVEMLHSFHESLMDLNDCENAHGMEDWYDRFGVMFYNFVEMRYHR
ncbi:hypothetical protein [Polaribacter sp.]|uniref:hypothetical protein n=1 Tax=Polaribacter sp. TaxID=1920175 RepID=UPI003EFA2F85